MSRDNLYRRGNAWYFRFKIQGQTFRGSCYTHRLDEARRILRQKMAEAEATPGAKSVATGRFTTVSDMLKCDRERCTRLRMRPEVFETTHGVSWRRIARHFAHAGEMTRDAVGIYANRLLHEGLSAQTVKRDLWAIKRGHEFARYHDPTLPDLGKLPRLGVDEPRSTRGQLVSLDVVAQWLALLRTPASRAQAVVGLLTGLRATELERLRASWLERVEVDGRTWYIVRLPRAATKGKKAREVAVHPLVADLIRTHVPFATNYRTAWRTASKRLGLTKPISMRDLRVTFGTSMGAFDFAGTKLIMGHTSDKHDATAMLYQRMDHPRLARLAQEAARVFAFALDVVPLGVTGGSKGAHPVALDCGLKRVVEGS